MFGFDFNSVNGGLAGVKFREKRAVKPITDFFDIGIMLGAASKKVSQMSRKCGMNKSDLVKNAIRRYLWDLRFKGIRTKGIERARRVGVYLDQDIFEQVS